MFWFTILLAVPCSCRAVKAVFFSASSSAQPDCLDEGTRIRLRDFNGPQLEPSDMSSEAREPFTRIPVKMIANLHRRTIVEWCII